MAPSGLDRGLAADVDEWIGLLSRNPLR